MSYQKQTRCYGVHLTLGGTAAHQSAGFFSRQNAESRIKGPRSQTRAASPGPHPNASQRRRGREEGRREERGREPSRPEGGTARPATTPARRQRSGVQQSGSSGPLALAALQQHFCNLQDSEKFLFGAWRGRETSDSGVSISCEAQLPRPKSASLKTTRRSSSSLEVWCKRLKKPFRLREGGARPLSLPASLCLKSSGRLPLRSLSHRNTVCVPLRL